MLSELVQTLKKHHAEHDASKVKTAFDEFDKDGSGAIDKSEL
jgi:Ca2+-binding EF-hand superfamily protein